MVPKLNHVTLLSISFSQTFIPVIIRLISQVTKEDPKQQRRKSQMPDDFDPKDLEAPKKKIGIRVVEKSSWKEREVVKF